MNKINFREEWGKTTASDKLRVAMWSFAAGALVLGIMCLTGCQSPNAGPMTHAAFTAAVTLGEQFALESKPEAIPYVRAAVPVVCGVANSTNASPAEVVAALQKAGITNAEAKIVINGGIALFNVVVSGIGTNQAEIQLYATDLCNGMQAGLPPENITAKMTPLPPHLK